MANLLKGRGAKPRAYRQMVMAVGLLKVKVMGLLLCLNGISQP